MSLSPTHQDRIDDSLDNLNMNKLRQSSLDKFRSQLIQVKQKFVAALQKLQSAQTRQIGIAEIRKIIDQYRQPDHLRNYIAILKNLKPNSNSTTKQHQILVVSLLAQIFRQNLIDPVDKPPSVLKTVFRLIEILHGYFADVSGTVQQACARALMDLTNFCLASQNSDTIISLVFSPLASILKTGVDKASQATASSCINEFILYWRKTENTEILEKISRDMLVVILKINSQYHQLFQGVGSMLQFKGLDFLEGKLVHFMAKILGVINATKESSNLNSYMCKVNVCKIIEKIGTLLELKEKEKFVDLNVIQSLEKAARNRIILVQMAAARALKAWKGEFIERQSSAEKARGLMSLEKLRNNKKMERSKSKEERDKLENQLTYMKQDLQKMVKGGWGANNRAKNFVKRGTGVGGGYHGKIDTSPQSKNNKTHKEHIDQLREYIKKGAKDNKNIERFSFAEQKKQRSRSKSPPLRKSPSLAKKGSQGTKKINADLQEPMLQVDDGDQQVYIHRKDSYNQKKVGKYANLGISQDEADQLLNHEDSLIREGQNMKINYHTNRSQKSHTSKGKSQKRQVNNHEVDMKKKSNFENQIRANQYINEKDLRINLRSNQIEDNMISFSKKAQKEKKQQSTNFQKLSQQELEELIGEQNLSQVSENLDDILNESDMHMENSKLSAMNSGILETVKGKSELQSMKQIIKQNKNIKNSRISAINKFFKKEDSVLQAPKPPQPPPVANEASKLINSLNFTESQASREKSPNKESNLARQNQFTLNPRDRFSTVKQTAGEPQKQIQQQIVMSYYQESIPKAQNILPIDTKQSRQARKSLEQDRVKEKSQGFIKNQYKIPMQDDGQVGKDYQNLIRNPPKISNSKISKFNDKKSVISHREKSQIVTLNDQQSENQPITEKWLQALRSTERGDFNNAYESVFDMDDPIYLLRLMLLTKSPVRKLTADNSIKLWQKFIEIQNHKFIDVLFVQLFGEANELSLLKSCLSVEQLQELMIGLYQVSGNTRGKLSFNAASLYNNVQASMKSR